MLPKKIEGELGGSLAGRVARCRLTRFTVVAAAASALALGLAQASAVAPRPNIVLILADDMGYSDIGCYGGEMRTPNLDRLAADGLRFTQFYNTGRCCPTRASLLTGLYPHQAGVGHMMEDRGLEAYRGDLNRHCVTIAEALRAAAYRTYMAGKWHVTKKVRPVAGEVDQRNWPLQRGFDRFYGTIHGAGSFFDPNSLTRDNTLISPYADPQYRPKVFYYTDAISDHAARFIREHADAHADRPFFLYVAYTAAHWPMHALQRDIAKYRGRFDAGYDSLRRERVERMRQLGLIDPGWALNPTVGQWDRVAPREWEIRCMEVYAAMIDAMDQGIGRILEALAETGRRENTLVLYLQDNGGCAEGLGRQPQGDYRERPVAPPFAPMPAEALQFDMIPKQTRDGYPVVRGPGILPGPADSYIAYGRAWANVSNTPFREYKHWVHEGGIATPLIAYWPNGLRPSLRNSLVREPAHLIDLMATCVDLAGADYPSERDGVAVRPLEGVSLRPLFQGEPMTRSLPIFFEHEGNRAVRHGRWKLVAKGPDGPWELYDMDADRTETVDLAAKEPAQLRIMVAAWENWAARTGVIPWIWRPAYEPTTASRGVEGERATAPGPEASGPTAGDGHRR